ncbi:FtsX-like permease family protein [Pengzhenrongella frigida]|uniref:ABC transporter permease n=1 Tax=Pengzhenrongella frigida TaxID=1259133 RepID=A0A4Q5N1A4_9MICO|nr:FtsX-like permease family protein [Cellulomonas sp. HLT2-17]RYV51942.1 ABC transporter permease [Cellulomonas sp. HLT2-17]
MSWSVRIMWRRAVAQRTIIATVLAVAILGSTLLGTFALLLTSSEQRALTVTLTRSPPSATELETGLTIGLNEPDAAIATAHAALAEVTGDLATTSSQWVASPPYELPRDGGASAPLGYLAAVPDVEALATLRSGTWPVAATDAAGRVQVTVPSAAAEHFAWSVGSEVPLESTATQVAARAVVVGVYDVTGDRTRWARDLLDGMGVDPSFPVPGTFGFILTSAYGPFVATPEALLGGGVEVASATIVTQPQIADSSPAALASLRARLDTAGREIAAAVGPQVTSSTFRSRLAGTIDSAQGQLAVTRVSVVVVGLMLAVLAITVLLLAARLLAERRATEQSLMASRGATGRQVLALAGLEALLVAALTTAVAPVLARLLYRLTTAQGVFRRAGLDVDPHLPGALWLTCAAASLVFAAVLLGPLLRRSTSVVDAEQQQVRQDRRGAVTRSGLDLALVALAAVAYWQLRQYRSPVLAGGGIDAVLVAGPALFLLAGAAVTLRLLPLVAAGAERLAARSRRLVLPLAAWEVGRRPGRASGAVLLLTLAVAVGVFSQSFLATWRSSQIDQADVQVGTDLRVDQLATAPFAQSSAITALQGATALSPVAARSVDLGAAPAPGMLPSVSTRADMVALDTRPGVDLVRGSAPTGPNWAAMLTTVAPTDVSVGAELPGTPTALRLTMTATAEPAAPTTRLLGSVVVQDARGLRVTFRLPAVEVDGAAHTVTVPLTTTDAPLVGPLRVVGLGSQLIEQLDPTGATAGQLPDHVDLGVTVSDLRSVQDGVETPAPFDPAAWRAQSLPDRWDPAVEVGVTSDDALALTTRGTMSSLDISTGTAGFTMTTLGPVTVVPVIASDALLDELGLEIGDRILVDVGISVTAEITASAPYLPSMPRGPGFLVDRDLLTRTLVAAGGTDPMLDEWWVAADADAAPTLASTARTELHATATSRYELGESLTDGPLPIGVQAALWTVAAASLLLAVAGFAMSATISVRLRRLEFARLEALGASRPGLVRAVLAEHTLLGALGVSAGVVLGALLGRLVVPLLTVAADGARPVPAVVVHWPWAAEGALLTLMVTLICVAVTSTTVALLRPTTSSLLRLGDDR